MGREIDEIHRRLDKLEEQKKDEVLTLVEILSNLTFFGEVKKESCGHSKNGQCTYFVLKNDARNKIPVVSECRIEECKEPALHCHLELSDITCSLCPKSKLTIEE